MSKLASIAATPHARRLAERELDRFYARAPRSLEIYRRAYATLPDGVPSGVCVTDPYPIVIASGEGAYLTDVDGNRYADFCNGFGTSVFGHAQPLITAAIIEQATLGTHFGAMTEPVARLAEHLCERYSLAWVRFSASGTEAVMDALRLARAATGRDKIAKIEGCYHGSSPEALISNNMDPITRPLRAGQLPRPRPASLGLPRASERDVVVLPFNDLAAARQGLQAGDVACLVLEPVLFNVGAIFPRSGYLEGLRELCDEFGTLLIFDEVKTGATIAWGGAEELFGVKPDVKTLGKGIGGGISVGALGDCTGKLRGLIEEWQVPHLGTFSGNPLMAAAGEAALTGVLTPGAYDGLQAFLNLLTVGLEQVIAEYELDAYVVGAGAKGCVVWADGARQLRDFRDYCSRFDGAAAELCWLYLVNRGVFLAPGQDEQFTFSVAHGPSEAALFVETFAAFARELRG